VGCLVVNRAYLVGRRSLLLGRHDRVLLGRQIMCEICQRKKNLFRVQGKHGEILACNDCITDNFLTGWSR